VHNLKKRQGVSQIFGDKKPSKQAKNRSALKGNLQIRENVINKNTFDSWIFIRGGCDDAQGGRWQRRLCLEEQLVASPSVQAGFGSQPKKDESQVLHPF